MNNNGSNASGPNAFTDSTVTIDSLVAHLSHRDRQVRQRAVVALGKTGDRRAVEPLIFTLTRELSLGASSFPVIIDILDAMASVPDVRAVDALVKLEAQIVDRSSPQCPAELPAGVITYVDAVDGRLHRIMPREVHFKVLDVMRRMSAQLGYRAGPVAARYQAYQQAVIEAEIDRMMPGMARAIQEGFVSEASRDAEGVQSDPATENGLPRELASGAGDPMAGVDYDVIRREMEIEVAEYLRDNERMQALIRQGQRIKAHIQHAKREKMKFEAAVPQPGRAVVR